MTDEDTFQTAMTNNREDLTVYLVFADWLQDRDDPRAEGYRVMGEFGLRPYRAHGSWFDIAVQERVHVPLDPLSNLPTVWFESLEGGTLVDHHVNRRTGILERMYRDDRDLGSTDDANRISRDAAAVAWSKLSAEQKEHARTQITGYHERVYIHKEST